MAAASASTSGVRGIMRIMGAPPRHWVGNGFHVFPVFHQLAFTSELSPWLMFDYAAPKEFGPNGGRRGVGQHPHRGFETITIAFQGEVEHHDSVGNAGVIGPGDVQWMTAGRGIIHEEYHSNDFAAKGGTFEMAQLWLNLPAKDKMTAPRYQAIVAKDMPVVPLSAAGGADDAGGAACDAAAGEGGPPPAGNVVKVIAGEFGGATGPALVHSPVELFDIQLADPGVPFELPVPEGHNVVLFVRRGAAMVGAAGQERGIEAQGVALLDRQGGVLRVVAQEAGTQLLLLGGQPLDEPIAARGPFVMNTQAELRQANEDFRSGRMGS